MEDGQHLDLRADQSTMAPNSYISTYQGDFGAGKRSTSFVSAKQGPSLVSLQTKVPPQYYQPQSWSSSSQGKAHNSSGMSKFSPSEWANSNVFHYNSADQSRHQSERIRGEALRLIADRDRRTVASQRQVDHNLEDRIRNINSWKSELNAELERNKNETNLMFRKR